MAGTAEDGPFHMVNFIRYREVACYPDGRETTLTGREADELYAPIEFLLAIGAEPVFVAEATETLLGDGTEWDQLGIVRYPSRAAFLSMVEDPEFQERAIHKSAGVEQSIVLVTDLRPSALPPDFEPAESPHPPTPQDPSLEMVHLMRLNPTAIYPEGSNEPERSGQEALGLYEGAAATVALELGVYPLAWFDVVDVLIGDGREWDQVRLNHMPSRAAFDALVADPDRLAAQYHREAALADTYSTLTLPQLNSLSPLEGG